MNLITDNSEYLASPVFWAWKCRDCKKEYPEHYKFTTVPYRCNCGGMVDLCVSETISILPCGHDRKACFDEYEKICIACKVEKEIASLSGYNAPVETNHKL